jgi:hypothetical protein
VLIERLSGFVKPLIDGADGKLAFAGEGLFSGEACFAGDGFLTETTICCIASI